MGDMDVYPTLLDMTKDECQRILRNLELEAYSTLVSVLRAQGSLSPQKKCLLQNVAQILSIPVERHKAECRRAVASEKLATIAKYMEGPNTATDWAIEGRRLIPLMPRLVPQTAFTALADQVANIAATEKASFPPEPMSKASTSAGTDENLLEEPSTPEASKTVQLCINPASLVTTLPASPPSPSTATSTQVSSQERTQNSCQSGPMVVQFSNDEEIAEEKISRKRDRSSSLDARSGDVFGSVAVQPPSKKRTIVMEKINVESESKLKIGCQFQENTNINASRPQTTLHSVPTITQTPAPAQPSKRAAVKLPAKSPTFQPKPFKLAELPDLKNSEKAEEQAHEIRSETQTSALPSLSSHTIPPLATPGSTVTRVTVPNHVKLSLASPTQGRTVQSPMGNMISTPSGTQKVIIVSSTTPSILQRSLSVPLVKAATAAANNQKQPPVVLNTVTNQPNSQNQQHPSTALIQQEHQSSKPTSTSQTIFIPQSTSAAAGTTVSATTGTTTPGLNVAPTTSNLQSSGSAGTAVSSKIPPKTRPRGNSIVIPMTLNQAASGGATVSNVQLKTLGTKPTTLHLKQDSSVKIMPITSVGGTKILPKPSSGQMFLVSSSSGASPTVSMVTRTVPAGSRVMAVNSPNTPRIAGGTSGVTSTTGRPTTILSMTSKSGQAVQMGMNSGTTGLNITSGGTSAKPNVIVVQKSSSGALSRGVTLTHGGKEVVGKVLLGKAVSAQGQNASQGGRHSVTVQKITNAAALLQAASGNQNQMNLPVPSSGNVIVLDLSQEQLSNRTMLSELLQGIIPSTNKNILETVSSNTTTTTSVSSTTVAKVINTIEEDTPLPCVSSDWLQTSDITSCVVSDNSVGSFDGLPVGDVGDASLDSAPQGTTTTTASPSVVVQSVVPSTSTGMDIFSTALSSADINLDSFQYLEDSSLDPTRF